MARTSHSLLTLLIVVTLTQSAFAGNANAGNNNDRSWWGWLFGGSKKVEKCDKCSGQGVINIENAHLMPGSGSGGGGGRQANINNMHGNQQGGNGNNNGGNGGGGGGSQISGEALIALEKEKTRQLELANAQKVQEEHERNKWFNVLVTYFDDRAKKEKEDQEKQKKDDHTQLFEKAKTFGNEFLAKHHAGLKEVERERIAHELEAKRLEQENMMKLFDHDMKKTELTHKQAMEKLTYIGGGFHSFLGDKQRLGMTVGALSLLGLGLYASKRSTKVAADYVASLLLKPTLVTETSRISPITALRHPIRSLKHYRRRFDLPPVIYNAHVQDHMDRYVASVKENITHNQPSRHGLFYGPPGTGKTLQAKTLALKLGMNYAIIPAPNIHQFGDKEAIVELNRLFAWANRSGKRTVLFFDEIDAMLPPRSGEMSEQGRKVVNTFLSLTGTETTKFTIVGATNEPALLDRAYLSRTDEPIELGLPDQPTRKALIEQYFVKYVKGNRSVKIAEGVEDSFEYVATQLEGFSGRDISAFARAIPAYVATEKNKVITQATIQAVVAQRIEQQEQLRTYSTRAKK